MDSKQKLRELMAKKRADNKRAQEQAEQAANAAAAAAAAGAGTAAPAAAPVSPDRNGAAPASSRGLFDMDDDAPLPGFEDEAAGAMSAGVGMPAPSPVLSPQGSPPPPPDDLLDPFASVLDQDDNPLDDIDDKGGNRESRRTGRAWAPAGQRGRSVFRNHR